MERNVSAHTVNIVDKPPSIAELKRALSAVGGQIARLFNTSGQVYREGNYKERLPAMSEREALLELSKNGKLIKRPLLIGSDVVLVGFRADEYEKTFNAKA
jgi:arsenate reductase (glutaredoxin)